MKGILAGKFYINRLVQERSLKIITLGAVHSLGTSRLREDPQLQPNLNLSQELVVITTMNNSEREDTEQMVEGNECEKSFVRLKGWKLTKRQNWTNIIESD